VISVFIALGTFRNQLPQQGQADVAVPLEVRKRQGNDEHLFVIPHIAVIVEPRRQSDIESRVFGDPILVNWPDLRQVTVRCRQ
jgi:hypothetical protein